MSKAMELGDSLVWCVLRNGPTVSGSQFCQADAL